MQRSGGNDGLLFRRMSSSESSEAFRLSSVWLVTGSARCSARGCSGLSPGPRLGERVRWHPRTPLAVIGDSCWVLVLLSHSSSFRRIVSPAIFWNSLLLPALCQVECHRLDTRRRRLRAPGAGDLHRAGPREHAAWSQPRARWHRRPLRFF